MIMDFVFVIAPSIIITTIFFFYQTIILYTWQMWHPCEIVQFDYCD